MKASLALAEAAERRIKTATVKAILGIRVTTFRRIRVLSTGYLSTTSNFASSTSREFDPTITLNSPGSATKRISRFQNAS